MKRTTLHGAQGSGPYALRGSRGHFKNIRTSKRGSAADLRRKEKADAVKTPK
jgi:hypothetical protein